MSDGQDIIPLKLLKSDGGLYPGEITGRPRDEAVAMIKAGRAERLRPAKTTAPAKPPEDKAVKASPKGGEREALAEMAALSSEIPEIPDDYYELKKLANDVAKERGDELEGQGRDYLTAYLEGLGA